MATEKVVPRGKRGDVEEQTGGSGHIFDKETGERFEEIQQNLKPAGGKKTSAKKKRAK